MTVPTSRHRCPVPKPRPSSTATRRSCRRRTRAAIRWSSSADRVRPSRTSTATCSSTAPPGIAVNSTGHSHPDVVKAIIEQAQKFLHMSGTDFYYEPQVRLAEELAAIAPIQGGVRSFFGNSGTEAIEACLKLSRYATGRQNIVAFLGAFHGRTMGSLSLTASKAIQRRGFGPLMPGVYHAPYPDCYRCPLGLNAGELRGRVPRFHRAPAVRASRLAGRSRGDRRRADPGRGRLRRRARSSSCSGCAS